MSADSLISGAFGLGGALIGVGSATWTQCLIRKQKAREGRFAAAQDSYSRLVLLEALLRRRLRDRMTTNDWFAEWADRIDELAGDLEKNFVLVEDEQIRERLQRALTAIVDCQWYGSELQSIDDPHQQMNAAHLLRIAVVDAKKCLAAYIRSEPLPEPPTVYPFLDFFDESLEEGLKALQEMRHEKWPPTETATQEVLDNWDFETGTPVPPTVS